MWALAGKPEYFTRKRVPLSAPGTRASKAEAKPSVTRVDAKRVPAPNRPGRSRLAGTGEPVHVIPVLDRVASSAVCGKATTSCAWFTGSDVERNAVTGCRSAGPS